MTKSKVKLAVSIIVAFLIIASMAISLVLVFASKQQTVETSNVLITYVAQDIDGFVSATCKIGSGEEQDLIPQGENAQDNKLVFNSKSSDNSGSLKFPENSAFKNLNETDEVVVKFTYTNTGSVHYVASLNIIEKTKENFNITYSTDGTTYSADEYAVVVQGITSTSDPASTKSYWIKFKISDGKNDAKFDGSFNWSLCGLDETNEAYSSLPSLEFKSQGNGEYQVAVVSALNNDTGELVFPSSVNGYPVTTIDEIGLTAKAQITTAYIPSSVTRIRIDHEAFKNCSNLTSITIEGDVSFGEYVFNGCTNLKEVRLYGTIRSSDIDSFKGWSNVEKLIIRDIDKFAISSIIGSSFGYGYNRDKTKLYLESDIETPLEEIEINSSSIGNYAFSFINGFKKVTIGSNVTSIGFCAFSNCTDITSVKILEGIKNLNGQIFYNCTGLTSITISSSVVFIPSNAFSGCSALTNVYYTGTATEWSKISTDSTNTELTNATRYYYSETQPTDSSGNYWHYNESGEVEVW